MEEKYPELKDRIQSTFIDMLLIVVLMFLIAIILDRLGDVADWVRIVLFIGLFIAYEPICIALGCTLGNYLKGIRVRKISNMARHINIIQSLVRYLMKVFLGWVSFVTIHSNPKRRAIHDLAAGSIMIKV